MRPTPSSSNGIALEASGLPSAFVERLLRAAQPESGPRRRIRIERARACEAVAETVSDAGGFTIRLPGLDSAYGRAGSNFWSQALHEVFHVRYSDFERFRQLDPYRARLANVFEDVRVDRMGLASFPDYHRMRAADLQRRAFHSAGLFAVGRASSMRLRRDGEGRAAPCFAGSLENITRLLLIEAYEAGFFMKFPLTSKNRARAAAEADIGEAAVEALVAAVQALDFERSAGAPDFAVSGADAAAAIVLKRGASPMTRQIDSFD